MKRLRAENKELLGVKASGTCMMAYWKQAAEKQKETIAQTNALIIAAIGEEGGSNNKADSSGGRNAALVPTLPQNAERAVQRIRFLEESLQKVQQQLEEAREAIETLKEELEIKVAGVKVRPSGIEKLATLCDPLSLAALQPVLTPEFDPSSLRRRRRSRGAGRSSTRLSAP